MTKRLTIYLFQFKGDFRVLGTANLDTLPTLEDTPHWWRSHANLVYIEHL